LSQKLQLQTEKTKSNKSIPKEVKKRVQNQLENQKNNFQNQCYQRGTFQNNQSKPILSKSIVFDQKY
jgi:hypothetical protein